MNLLSFSTSRLFQELAIMGMAQPSDGSYEQFVIVAEDQHKINFPKINCTCQPSAACATHFDGIKHKPKSSFSVYFAGFEWEYKFKVLRLRNVITLGFKGFARGQPTDREMHLEVFLCDEKFKLFPECLHDHASSETAAILLSIYSPYFNALFNGNFNEAKQDEIELKGKTETDNENPALFHDFLMAISLPSKDFQDALPNAKNVAGLLALAQCYQVNLVRDKCERHLKFCHEMPAAERLILAKKYGLKEVQDQIVQEQKTMEDKDALINGLLEADF